MNWLLLVIELGGAALGMAAGFTLLVWVLNGRYPWRKHAASDA